MMMIKLVLLVMRLVLIVLEGMLRIVRAVIVDISNMHKIVQLVYRIALQTNSTTMTLPHQPVKTVKPDVSNVLPPLLALNVIPLTTSLVVHATSIAQQITSSPL